MPSPAYGRGCHPIRTGFDRGTQGKIPSPAFGRGWHPISVVVAPMLGKRVAQVSVVKYAD